MSSDNIIVFVPGPLGTVVAYDLPKGELEQIPEWGNIAQESAPEKKQMIANVIRSVHPSSRVGTYPGLDYAQRSIAALYDIYRMPIVHGFNTALL